MGKLDGKVALVTGSGRNIGRATVLKLAGEGAHVVVNARSNQAEADAVVREAKGLGVKAIAVVADVASKDQVEAMAARALSEFGRVDILINNAAIRPHKPFTELTAQDWEAVRGVVLDGALYLTRAVIESMVKNTATAASCSLPAKGHSSAATGVRMSPRRRWAWWDSRAGWRPSSLHTTSGSTWFPPAASIRRGQIPNGTRDTRRTPRAFHSAVRARWTRSPPPACSWSATMVVSSPARRSM